VIDWHIYNESLVRRGEVVLDFDVIDNWNNELDNMNEGKEGASYVLCSLISRSASLILVRINFFNFGDIVQRRTELDYDCLGVD
jgi:hypothetical protein